MFRIKICGITNVEGAAAAAAAGADALGLNFCVKSPRYVSPAAAEPIVAAVPAGVVKVGVFVNAPADEVAATAAQLGLDLVQLHGDEPPEFLAQLRPLPVMKAFRLGNAGLDPVRRYLAECHRLGCPPRLTLIDSQVAGQYGGTGEVADWEVARRYPSEEWHPPLVLAGGLTPQNVAEAIRAVQPAAVDTASGVELSPGHKDPQAMAAFVQAARQAFGSLATKGPNT
jgi:phosphoribosylanthranilate isomerase